MNYIKNCLACKAKRINALLNCDFIRFVVQARDDKNAKKAMKTSKKK